jgi:hypothetical protein
MQESACFNSAGQCSVDRAVAAATGLLELFYTRARLCRNEARKGAVLCASWWHELADLLLPRWQQIEVTNKGQGTTCSEAGTDLHLELTAQACALAGFCAP